MTVLALALAGCVLPRRAGARSARCGGGSSSSRAPSTSCAGRPRRSSLACERLRREPRAAHHAAALRVQLDRLAAGSPTCGGAPRRPCGSAAPRAGGAARRGRRAALAPWEVEPGAVAFEWRGGRRPRASTAGALAQALGNLIANAAEHGAGEISVRGRTHARRGADRGTQREPPPASAVAAGPGAGAGCASPSARRGELGGRLLVDRARRETVAVLELPRSADGGERTRPREGAPPARAAPARAGARLRRPRGVAGERARAERGGARRAARAGAGGRARPACGRAALDAARSRVRRVPARFVPPDALGAAAERRPAPAPPCRSRAGGYLTAGLLGGGGGPSPAAAALGRGERAVEVGVSGGGLGKRPAPGSRVDVLVSTEPGAGGGRTFVALEDVELLALRGDAGGRLRRRPTAKAAARARSRRCGSRCARPST